MKKVLRDGLVLPALSYQVVGACFDAFNNVGPGKSEKIYQRAVAGFLYASGIRFREQVRAPIVCEGVLVGEHRFDFLIENKLILELKVGGRFRHQDYDQIKRYLLNSGVSLGILVRFGPSGVVHHRILPPPSVHS